MTTSLGSTETGPGAIINVRGADRPGMVGVPHRGVELKLVPNAGKLEARLRGPNITPGYWRRPDLTAAAFDEEGFYKIGDALRLAVPGDYEAGFVFDGRVSEDFKLATGTWVSVGPLRLEFLAAFAPLAQDVVIAAPDRDDVGALVFPNEAAVRKLAPHLPAQAPLAESIADPAVKAAFRDRLAALGERRDGVLDPHRAPRADRRAALDRSRRDHRQGFAQPARAARQPRRRRRGALCGRGEAACGAAVNLPSLRAQRSKPGASRVGLSLALLRFARNDREDPSINQEHLMKIEGVAAIVTGGGSGLGRATAEALAAKGAKVAIFDLNAGAAEAAAKAIDGVGIACDVSDAASAEAAIARAEAAHGAARILINCAGIGVAKRVVGRDGPHPLADFERVIKVNLIGTFNMIRLAAAAMAKLDPLEGGERGVIVSTASVAAFDGQIGQAAYSASKAAVAGMTLPIARDLASIGVRVNTIAPGIFLTPMLLGLSQEFQDSLGRQVPFPPRLGDPKEYASLAVQIVENSYLNGETIRLDGSLRMQPR